MRNAKIVTLYKNKSNKGECSNYRGISLLSITGKTFARVILKCLHILAERILLESQCGFRAGRSTVDSIFTLRQLQEKCREQGKPLLITFVDLTKAFDTVSRLDLYNVLVCIGCPPTFLSLIRSFHEDMTASVLFDGQLSDSFPVRVGVKQGCVLAPTLFGIYFAVLLHCAFGNVKDTGGLGDVYIRSRQDGSMFNLKRLKANSRTTEALITDLLYADDAALVAHDERTLQQLIDHLHSACHKFSLSINVKKTVVLSDNTS